ncbi:MAG: membrane protein insertion efficiency factor YidD [Gammaproteobacteria bacterium]|nr:MAG: membrane protein insertion efficiency factor YidD [Gammaproteobacteria bacterium]
MSEHDPKAECPPSWPARLLLGLIRLYQLTLSPFIGRQCRFWPTCSEYGMDAIRVHGALKGSVLTVRRLLRCHPWSEGGEDPVPPAPQSCHRCKRSDHP